MVIPSAGRMGVKYVGALVRVFEIPVVNRNNIIQEQISKT